MRLRSPVALPALLAVVGVTALSEGRIAAQYVGRTSVDRYQHEWENDRFHVRRVALAPGGQMAAPEAADSVLVYLTTDLEGRMPPAEAVWQPAGPRTLENRGSARFEAIAIELKEVPTRTVGVTPAEALLSTDRVDVSFLIDNPRVVVIKQRYAPNSYGGPLHFHPQDTVVVYLRGGYPWPANGSWGGYRVSRGDLDLVPANTFHTVGNAGGDPLEFLMIIPK